MATHNERVARLAAEANSYLRRDTARDILLPADDAPAWFSDLCREAHGGMMPDDWRYEFIQDSLSALEDEADEDGIDLDGLYPYTADRLDWLTSHLDRPAYCDEVARDLGAAPAEILAFVVLGMDRELREVFALVRSKLEEIAADENDGHTN
jgi:hypothetical protein